MPCRDVARARVVLTRAAPGRSPLAWTAAACRRRPTRTTRSATGPSFRPRRSICPAQVGRSVPGLEVIAVRASVYVHAHLGEDRRRPHLGQRDRIRCAARVAAHTEVRELFADIGTAIAETTPMTATTTIISRSEKPRRSKQATALHSTLQLSNRNATDPGGRIQGICR